MIKLVAIYPKRKIDIKAIEQTVQKALDDYADAVIRRMASYPAWRPWKNPPRAGLRRGGRRTGNYGRGWRKIREGNGRIAIVNPVTYARWVGGPNDRYPGQARALRARGWPSITDVARDEGRKHRPILNRAVTTFWR